MALWQYGSLMKILIIWKPNTPLVTDWPRDAAASIHGWPAAGDLGSTEVGGRAHITAPVSTPGLATAPSLDSRGREAQISQCLADQLEFVNSNTVAEIKIIKRSRLSMFHMKPCWRQHFSVRESKPMQCCCLWWSGCCPEKLLLPTRCYVKQALQ